MAFSKLRRDERTRAHTHHLRSLSVALTASCLLRIGSHPGVVDGRQTLLSQKCQTSHLQHQWHFKFLPPSLRPNLKEVSVGVVATLRSPQMSKGPVQTTECVVQPLKVLVTNLKKYDFSLSNDFAPCTLVCSLMFYSK